MLIAKLTRRPRFLIWLTIAFFRRHFSLLVLLVLSLSLLVFVFSQIVSSQKKSYNEGVVGNYTIAQIPPRVTRLISTGLLTFDNSGQVQPALIEKWQVEDNGKKFSFILKPNLKWQDGTLLKSSDIAIALEGVRVDYQDDKTIIFNLKEPFSPFPSVLTRPVFKKNTLIGTGFYKIDKVIKKNDFVSQVRLKSLKGELPIVNFFFYPNDSLAITALKIGEVQAISNLSNAPDLEKWENLTIVKKFDPQKYVAIFFDTQSGNLSQKEIRVALNQAIHRDNFQEQQALGPISSSSWVYNNNLKKFNYDLEKAKKIITEKSKELIKLRMITTPTYKSLAKQVIDDWSKIGVTTELQIVNSLVNGADYDLLLTTQDIPYDPDQYIFWHSTQMKTNKSKFSDPKIDKFLEDGRKITDQAVRKQKYLDFQKYLVEDSPAAFLYHPNQYFIYYNNISKTLDDINKEYKEFKIE